MQSETTDDVRANYRSRGAGVNESHGGNRLRHDLAALLPAVSGDPVTGRRGRDELAQAVSERWAQLVSAWTVSPPASPPAGRADG